MGQAGRATTPLTGVPARRSSGSRRPFVQASASAVMLVLGACASQPAEPDSAATVTTVASSASTTTADQPTTTASFERCPSGMGAAAQTPAQAAVCFHRAWQDGNRRNAAVFASLDVVDRLFLEGKAPSGARFGGCRSDGNDGEVCSYEHPGVEYRFQVRRSEGGWRVTGAQEAAT